jgi:hypothetical protein
VKCEHLVCYDYGQGGVWAFVWAHSPDDINQKFPELQVVETKPNWMTAEVENRIRSTMSIDIDDAANAFLAALISQRHTPT